MSNIEHNKKKFGRRIEQLDHILKDNTFLTDGSYREFVVSMYKALTSGRKITPKMESAITKIVKSYAKTMNPEYRKERLDYTENTISKLNMIKRRLDQCNYTRSYTADKLWFLESIEKQVYSRGSLSVKQRKALNKMYLQFEKKLEKSEKKT
jgi:arginine decarboxylase-like protein